MNKRKDYIFYILLIVILIVIAIYRETIIQQIAFIYGTYNVHETKNIYTKDENYLFLQKTDDFIPKNKNELINIIYTILDDGMNSFKFHCDKDYTECEEDLKNISDTGMLSVINNYVHPFNSFNNFNLMVNNYGVVEVNIIKTYTTNEIDIINTRLDEILNDIIDDNMRNYDKIKAFHDYIVNNTVYNEEEGNRITANDETLDSHKAYDILVNHTGVCEGYTDILAIFLDRLGIKNYKVSSPNHIWNVVFLDNKWQHIDMTWDDPINKQGKNILIHDYFMLSTNELLNKDTKHNFDKSLYLELN